MLSGIDKKKFRAINNTNITIRKGSLITVVSWDKANAIIMMASSLGNDTLCAGIALEDIQSKSVGNCVSYGEVVLPTKIYYETGTILYLSDKPGEFSHIPGTIRQQIGYVSNNHSVSKIMLDIADSSYSAATNATPIRTCGFRVISDSNIIESGSKGYVHIAYTAEIIKVRAIATTVGNIECQLKVNTVVIGTIELTADSDFYDDVLTGWDVNLIEDDLIELYIVTNSTEISDISIFIDIKQL